MRASSILFRAGALAAADVLAIAIVAAARDIRALVGIPEWAGKWTEGLPTPFTKKAARPERAADATVRDRLLSPACPKASFDCVASFPRDMDSGCPADRALDALASSSWPG
ncbi:MAG: hypothetical protein LBT40_06045 [Deltaproteobacteria bacterium]|nr:hypothetical protein [Deltaproteobacteria bacterium]